MQERGLELSHEKTSITHIADGFDFLGKTVRKYRGKLLITPSKQNVKTFLGKIRKLVKANAQTSAGQVISLLNPVIRGWATYHRHDVSKATFNSVDYAIFTTLWRWAKRSHPTKSRRWVRKKYFTTTEGRTWVFFGERTGTDGKRRTIQLVYASSIPIHRHTKVVSAANPYDPLWEPYFTRRRGIEMEVDLHHQRKLLWLWKEQQGICPICNQPITKLTRWHAHHMLQRRIGGGDDAENLLLLHPNCHRQVHSQQLVVTKPRPL
jgi:RNA-directed DNA polymerase